MSADLDRTPVSDDELADRIGRLRERWADRARPPKLIAVTKGFGPAVIHQALRLGLRDLGESYAQELLAKAADVGDDVSGAVRWHMIGRLQSRKVRALAPLPITLWQSIDRPKLLSELARHAPGARILIQVAISGEPQKGGVAPAELDALISRGRELGLRIDGLMGVATNDPERAPREFALLTELADRHDLPERSMGMSADLDAALDAGTTMVRVGSALFGPRPSRGT